MKKTFFVLTAIITGIYVAEARKRLLPDNEGPVQISAKWETGYKVKKLYTTPLGAVYEFARPSYNMPASPFIFWHKGLHKNCDVCKKRDKLKKQFYSIQAQFFKSENALRKQNRRYVVIDFKVRLFPVKQKPLKQKSERLLNFVLWTSDKLNQVYDLTELNGIESLGHSNTGTRYHSKYFVPDTPRQPYFLTTTRIVPYKTYNYRIIYDTLSGNNCIQASNYDGMGICILGEQEKNIPQYPIKSIGIFLVEHKVRDRLIELSDPVIRMVNTEEEFKKLPPVKPLVYPYDRYPVPDDKTKRTRNSDEIYAQAMRFLSGNGVNCDFIKGIELLKKAAGKKHIFAMYQLGVCYYRGIGVPVDYKSALEWLGKAENEQLDDAKALKAVLLFRQAKMVYGENSALKKQLKSLLKDAQPLGTGHNLRLASLITGIECIIPQIDYTQSPKLAYWAALRHFPFLRPPKKILDQQNALIKKFGLFSFYYYQPTQIQKSGIQWKIFSNFGRLSYDWMDMAVGRNFSPAMYFKGMILSNPNAYKGTWEKDAGKGKALALFKQGAALGNLDCELQAMRIQAKNGKLTSEDLDKTVKKNGEILDKPLYYLLKYSLENKDKEWSKAFLNGDVSTAERLWEKDKNGLSYCLSVLCILEQLQWRRITYRLVPGFFHQDENEKLLDKALELLTLAAKSGNVPSLYLLGKYKLEGELTSRDYTSGMKYLEKAAQGGHLGAELGLAKEYWKASKNRNKTLKYLKKPCLEGGFSEAWLLMSEVWKNNLRNPSSGKMVIRALQKAGTLGNPQAFNELGMIYYYGKYGEKKDIGKAGLYWSKFIKLDKEKRNQDIWDLYWGKIEYPKPVMDQYGLPMPAYTSYNMPYSIETKKKYYDTFN